MAVYPINETSISFTDIKQNIVDFVQSKPDASRWRDFYTGGEGTILIELIAGLGFYTALKVIFAKEETYLQYARTLLSARAIALNSAYSAFRGKNRRCKIRFTSTVAANIPALEVIGYQGNYDIINLESCEFGEGEEVELEVAVGKLQISEPIEAPSADLFVFRFNQEAVSDDYKLTLNDVEVPTTSISSEALEDMYLVQSNAVGGVNAVYLNLQEGFKHTYKTGDALRLTYIEYQNIPYSEEMSIDYAVDGVKILETSNPEEPETIESIQVKAPIMFATQQTIRSREDYVHNFLQLGSKFTDTAGRDLSAAYMELSYIQNDKSILTEEDTLSILQELTYKRMFGIPMPYINKPKYTKIDLDVHVRVNDRSELVNYSDTVTNILSTYEYVFGLGTDYMKEAGLLSSSPEFKTLRIDIPEIERLIEATGKVKRASVRVPETPFAKDSWYELGSTISFGANSTIRYRVADITFQTAAQEPQWNYELYSYTNDGNVQWQAIPQSGYPEAWSPKEAISMYDLRVPTEPQKRGIMFRATYGKSVSGQTEPQWKLPANDNELKAGVLTEDEQLIWLAVKHVATAPLWDVNTWYDIGDVIRTSGSSDYSFQVIGLRRKSSSTAPKITGEPDFIYYENMLLVKEVINDEVIDLPWGSYCIINPTITAST